MPNREKRVALLVETSLGSGREILRGIANYAHQYQRWHLFHAAGGLTDEFPGWMENWQGDGVIARIQTEGMAERLAEWQIPVVDVLGVCDTPFPLVHVDDTAISGLVVDHFRERDFKHFGFFGISGENWSERRCAAFRDICLDHADSFDALLIPRGVPEGSLLRSDELRQWLCRLPKPVGIMVCSDQRGLLLLEACRAEGISVPEQMAVVGVDNDLALCEISAPTLSSVRGGHFRVGFEAARLLDRFLREEPLEMTSPILVPPNEVVIRDSSDVRAIDDPAVAHGIRFIRDHIDQPITNDTVAQAAGVSRTPFQKRFRKATGQTIRNFILDCRVQKAVDLIENSEFSIAEIAERTGFKHQEYLGHVIRTRLGRTPGEIRKRSLEENDPEA